MNYKEFERFTGIKLKWWQKIHCSLRWLFLVKLNRNHPLNKLRRFAKKIHSK
jgi:hypothetical protein